MRVRSVKRVGVWAVALALACPAMAQGQPGGAGGAGAPPKRPDLPFKPVMVPQQKMPGESATAPRGGFMPEGVDARAAIAEAVARAKALDQRVAVVWGGNGTAEAIAASSTGGRAGALKTVMTLPDVQRILGREYQVVLANVHDGVYASDNMAVARAFGVKFDAEDDKDGHAVLMALDAAGAPAAQMSLSSAVDRAKPGRYLPDKVEVFLVDHKAPMPSAEEVLNAALAKAKAETRHVFLRFHEPPNEWGDRFEAWLSRPEIAAILSKHMVVARIDITRNALGGDLFARYAARPQGYPWYVIVDETGTALAYSQPPTPAESRDPGKNIGFPTDDGEIAAFIALIRVGAPTLSGEEEKVIRDSLVAEREAVKPQVKGGK